MSQQEALTSNRESTLSIFPQIQDIRTDPETKQTFLKAFLISDKQNAMNWQIPSAAIKKYVNSFINKPLIMHPTGLHPDYFKEAGLEQNHPTFLKDVLEHDKRYAIGDIIDTQYEKIKSASGKDTEDHAWFAYVRLYPDKADSLTKLKQASSDKPMYVSPQIFDIDGPHPDGKTYNYYPIHLAVVKDPAYGAHAQIRGMCNGEGNKCMQELKSAAFVYNSSLDKNDINNDHKLPNSNLTNEQQMLYQQQQQQQAQQQQNQGFVNQPPTNSILSESKQVKEQTPDGKIIVKQETAKPAAPLANLTNPPVNDTIPDPNLQQNVKVNQDPATQNPPLPFDFSALPKEVKDMMTNMQSMQKEFQELKDWKSSQEDEKLKQAAEQQRATIEAALSGITDPTVRSGLVDFFVSLNVQDDQLQKLLELYTTGVFQPDNQNQDPNAQAATAAPPAATGLTKTGKVPSFPKKPGLKGAAYVVGEPSAIMTNESNYGINRGRYRTGVFSDVDVSGFNW